MVPGISGTEWVWEWPKEFFFFPQVQKSRDRTRYGFNSYVTFHCQLTPHTTSDTTTRHDNNNNNNKGSNNNNNVRQQEDRYYGNNYDYDYDYDNDYYDYDYDNDYDNDEEQQPTNQQRQRRPHSSGKQGWGQGSRPACLEPLEVCFFNFLFVFYTY